MIETNEFSDSSWGHCLSLKNDQVELIIPFEFGPRVIRFAFIGEKNHFGEFPAQKSDPDKGKWHSYGGHRLWHGPEDIVRTYVPDNDRVKVESSPAAILIQQKIEAPTQLQKEMQLHLDPTGTHVKVTHRIRNHNLFAIRLAVWAVSVMATQGRAIIPLPPRGTHPEDLRAQTSLSLWAYTDLKDTRWQFGQKYVSIRQDPANSEAQKIGIARSGGWLAYLNENQAFVKKCRYVENQTYPDESSAFEIYTDHNCTELESLSPLTTIEPGSCAELVENWYLFKDIGINASESDLDQKLAREIL
jgi:hypothetical protein